MTPKYTGTGADLIARERQRQIEVEGFNSEHDDEHRQRELVHAAISYASYPQKTYLKEEKHGNIAFREPYPGWWNPWWNKCTKHTELKRLIIAGALIAAEIDQILREMGDFAEIEQCPDREG
ncbi:hypothetical protein ES708_03957 [subsurface metagenome]